MFPVHISMYWFCVECIYIPTSTASKNLSQGRGMRKLFQHSFVYSQALCCQNLP